MLNLIKTAIFGAIFGKNHHFGLDLHISDTKTDTFISFGADLFVYLKHTGIHIKEKITGKIESCV